MYDSQDFATSDEEVSSSDEDKVDGGKVSPNIELSTSDTEWETVTMDTPTPLTGFGEPRSSSEQEPRQSTTTSLVSSVTSLWPWKS